MDNISLSLEISKFYGESIDSIKEPTPLIFYRDYVSQNKPCIIRNAASKWNALEKWSLDYLAQALEKPTFEIDVTLDGYSDVICETEFGQVFVQPEVQRMKFAEFLKKRSLSPGLPHYLLSIYKEGNFLNEDFAPIHDDIEEMKWVSDAFGYGPDAVNIWIGDHRNVASVHRDEYENIYSVVTGEKHFIIYPPSDYHFLYPKDFEFASYKTVDGKLTIQLDDDRGEKQTWFSVDPLKPDLEKFPLYKHATPFRVTLQAGDTLYLPSLWFHHVMQSDDKEGKAISINYWYDMTFGPLYLFQKSMVKLIN